MEGDFFNEMRGFLNCLRISYMDGEDFLNGRRGFHNGRRGFSKWMEDF